MCRHLSYLGPPAPAVSAVLDAPHALVTQVDAPRFQMPGIDNRDGWGIAWREGDQWRQRRSTVPLSEDPAARDELAAISSAAFVAAIRRASPGAALTEAGNAPFLAGPWAFSLNGFVGGFFDDAGDSLRRQLSPARRDALAGDADSEVLFGLVLDRIDRGTAPADALGEVVREGLEVAGDRTSRLNLLLADGTSIWASRWANSLFVRGAEGAVAVASEPWDDDDAWVSVPDRSILTATDRVLTIASLA